jgi:hypothetical protein
MPRDIAGHLDDFEDEVEAIVRAVGLPVEVDLVAENREQYHRLSQAAHNARPGFADSVALPLRAFAYGPHPDVRAALVYVEMTGVLVESCLIAAGNALAQIIGGEFYRDQVVPLLKERAAVEDTMPVNAAVRQQWGWDG